MSLDDRLSFGDSSLEGLPPEGEPEGEPGRRRPNRAFIFLIIAVSGLILLGILAVAYAWLFWVPQQRAQQEAAVTQTIQAMTQVAAAWTATFTPVPTQPLPTWTPTTRPTWTAIPTATATRVLGEGAGTPSATATATSSALAGWGAPADGGTGTKPGVTTPAAGLGGFGMGAIAVGLAGLVIVIRKLRSG